jgi:hypothetical protein
MKVLAMSIGAIVLIALTMYGAYCVFNYLKGKSKNER